MKDNTYKKWVLILGIIGAMQNIIIILNALGEAINNLLTAIAPYTNIIIIGILIYFGFIRNKKPIKKLS